MEYLMIARRPDGTHSVQVESNPEDLSDFRDALGRPSELLATVPISEAVAAPALLEACLRCQGELVYMAEKLPWSNARDALKIVQDAITKATDSPVKAGDVVRVKGDGEQDTYTVEQVFGPASGSRPQARLISHGTGERALVMLDRIIVNA